MPDGESRESQAELRDRAGKSEFQFVDSHVRQSWPLFRRLVSRSVGWLVGWLVALGCLVSSLLGWLVAWFVRWLPWMDRCLVNDNFTVLRGPL